MYTLKVIKCVWQFHDKGSELKPIFDYFRFCTNEIIRIGSQKQNTSRFSLHKELYRKLRGDFHSKYVLGSLECAASKLKQYRKAKRKKPDSKIPYIWKNMLTLDNQSWKITNGYIRIPIRKEQYCFIKLTSYVLKQLENMKLGSIIVTERKLIISFSKEIKQQKSVDFLAIDRNLNNATTFDTQNNFTVHSLHKITKIKERYSHVKSKFKRNDARISKKIFQKYGIKEKNRTHQLLHLVSKRIVSENKGIILEDLKGIRKLYRKRNGQSRKNRHKMNSWLFYQLQRQIEYKARWLGLSVKYVNAYGTSSKCATCGSKTIPEEHRMLFCPCCKVIIDRDINAAKNILARGMQIVPDALQGEAMKQSKHVEQIVPSQVSNQSIKA